MHRRTLLKTAGTLAVAAVTGAAAGSQNGAWVLASPSNSSLSAPPPGGSFDCPSLTFTVVHPNDHWSAHVS
jgi:hypothetical protein